MLHVYIYNTNICVYTYAHVSICVYIYMCVSLFFFSLNQIQLLFVVSWLEITQRGYYLRYHDSGFSLSTFLVLLPQFEFLIVSQLHVTTTPISATVYCLSRGQSCTRVYSVSLLLELQQRQRETKNKTKENERAQCSSTGFG